MILKNTSQHVITIDEITIKNSESSPASISNGKIPIQILPNEAARIDVIFIDINNLEVDKAISFIDSIEIQYQSGDKKLFSILKINTTITSSGNLKESIDSVPDANNSSNLKESINSVSGINNISSNLTESVDSVLDTNGGSNLTESTDSVSDTNNNSSSNLKESINSVSGINNSRITKILGIGAIATTISVGSYLINVNHKIKQQAVDSLNKQQTIDNKIKLACKAIEDSKTKIIATAIEIYKTGATVFIKCPAHIEQVRKIFGKTQVIIAEMELISSQADEFRKRKEVESLEVLEKQIQKKVGIIDGYLDDIKKLLTCASGGSWNIYEKDIDFDPTNDKVEYNNKDDFCDKMDELIKRADNCIKKQIADANTVAQNQQLNNQHKTEVKLVQSQSKQITNNLAPVKAKMEQFKAKLELAKARLKPLLDKKTLLQQIISANKQAAQLQTDLNNKEIDSKKKTSNIQNLTGKLKELNQVLNNKEAILTDTEQSKQLLETEKKQLLEQLEALKVVLVQAEENAAQGDTAHTAAINELQEQIKKLEQENLLQEANRVALSGMTYEEIFQLLNPIAQGHLEALRNDFYSTAYGQLGINSPIHQPYSPITQIGKGSVCVTSPLAKQGSISECSVENSGTELSDGVFKLDQEGMLLSEQEARKLTEQKEKPKQEDGIITEKIQEVAQAGQQQSKNTENSGVTEESNVDIKSVNNIEISESKAQSTMHAEQQQFERRENSWLYDSKGSSAEQEKQFKKVFMRFMKIFLMLQLGSPKYEFL